MLKIEIFKDFPIAIIQKFGAEDIKRGIVWISPNDLEKRHTKNLYLGNQA